LGAFPRRFVEAQADSATLRRRSRAGAAREPGYTLQAAPGQARAFRSYPLRICKSRPTL